MKKLSLTSQIIILIASMGTIGVIVGIYGIQKMNQSNENVNTIVEDSFLPFENLKNISYLFKSDILLEMEEIRHQTIAIESGRKRIETKLKKAESLINAIHPNTENPEELNFLQEIKRTENEIKINLGIWLNHLDMKDENAEKEFAGLLIGLERMQENLDALMNLQKQNALIIQKNNQGNFTKSKIYFGIALVLGVGISIALTLIILMGVKAYIGSINRLLRKIASGNLSTKIEHRGSKDFGEIQDNLGFLSDKFTAILEVAQSAADNISITSEELSSNAQIISMGANQQAANVEEIASSMNQISSRVQENTENTLSTQKISSEVSSDVKIGSDIVNKTLEAIQSIADKISIIGDIAFQTNILALNAAVEAARAGEHGKGFGVVAAEVGKLADRSKAASIEIDALSASGVELALKSRELLLQFVSDMEETSKLISQITSANLEQNSGIKEMNTSIQKLNQITQQNASSSEEMATVSEQLTAQAQMLKESIQYFTFQEQGNKKNKTQNYLKQATERNL